MAATDFSSLFAGEKIKKADLIQLKQEIREMILKRIYNINISQYGSSLYDYTDSKPYNTEGSVNFQELGMMAVAECRESANAIFKDIPSFL